MTTVSVVIETDGLDGPGPGTLTDCLDAVARQTYPAELIEVMVVDGGKVQDLASIVRTRFPAAVILPSAGASRFEQKNIGMRAARGDIIALVDSDGVAAADWIALIVGTLARAPAQVAGVQGVTVLTGGPLSRELSAFFYGTRAARDGSHCARLLTGNCALRRDIAQRFTFDHAGFSSGADSLLLRRLTRDGYRILLCEKIRMYHRLPASARDLLRWVVLRAYGVGYNMVRVRQVSPDLPGGALVRWGVVGWPVLALGKSLLDVGQVWENRHRVNARPVVALAPLLAFETALFLGGMAALLRLSPPRKA